MSVGVFTRRKRVTFVDGQETYAPDPGFVACGDGCAFPIEVTGGSVKEKFDKIAEIWFRVKDAWFTGGSITWTVDSSPVSFNPPSTGPPSTRVVDLGSSPTQRQRRGYNIEGDYEYNDPEYDAGNGVMYSDIDADERGILKAAWNEGNTYEGISHPSTTAFTYASVNPYEPPDTTWWFGDNGSAEYGGGVMARFNGQVAVVKANPTDGLFAATNKYYLGFEFSWTDYNVDLSFGGTTDLYTSVFWGYPFDFYAETCRYVLRLATGDLSCPLYIGTVGGADFGGSDIIHEATEWWPYLDGGGPVWDAATGEPIPDGALGLTLDDPEALGIFLLLF